MLENTGVDLMTLGKAATLKKRDHENEGSAVLRRRVKEKNHAEEKVS
jgi:hypothetical protein